MIDERVNIQFGLLGHVGVKRVDCLDDLRRHRKPFEHAIPIDAAIIKAWQLPSVPDNLGVGRLRHTTTTVASLSQGLGVSVCNPLILQVFYRNPRATSPLD